MAKAHCRTIMFGIESGSQKILDRLKKRQMLEEVKGAVTTRKNRHRNRAWLLRRRKIPDETVEDIRATLDYAAKLPLDTFAFNRLCVYRGTPLWQEYLNRKLVNDETELVQISSARKSIRRASGEVVNKERAAGLRGLFLYKLLHYPGQTFTLLRRFLRYMPLRHILYILAKPFMGAKRGATKAEQISRAVEHQSNKDQAAEFTQVSDESLVRVAEESRLERQRLLKEQEKAPMDAVH